jgi:hypothetical protein
MKGGPVKGFTSLLSLAFIVVACGQDPQAAELKAGQASLRYQVKTSGTCIDKVELDFPEPINEATLLGKLTAVGDGNYRRALAITGTKNNGTSFTFAAAHSRFCMEPNNIRRLALGGGYKTTSGRQQAATLEIPVSFSQSIQSGQKSLSLSTIAGPRCVQSNCFNVSPAKLSQGMQQLRSWLAKEKNQPYYKQSSLKTLPMSGTILKLNSEWNRPNQYANPDLIYTIRRAAKLTEYIVGKNATIPVADMSNRNGQTPTLSDGTTPAHPLGSHTKGQDVDLAYIPNSQGGIDMEKSFWLVYSILQSTGVDMVITAYKAEFIQMARKAHGAGLINSLALGRFNKLTHDDGLNHDKHLHVSVRNSVNRYVSRRFLLSDDVYNCYLSLRPDYSGGELNFCGDPK